MPLDHLCRDIVQDAMISTAGIGGGGALIPVFDLAAIAGNWTGMVVALAEASGHPTTKATVGKVVAAAVSGVSGYYSGSKILTFLAPPLIAAFPIAGVPTGTVINVMLNGLFTYRLGMLCAAEFARPGFAFDDLGDLALRIGKLLIKIPAPSEIGQVKALLFD